MFNPCLGFWSSVWGVREIVEAILAELPTAVSVPC